MKVYFVRHGQTELNAARQLQHPETPLSENGRQQASFVAKRFTSIEIDTIIASDLPRAKVTAEIIAERIQKPISFTPLLRELKKPSEYRGKTYDDPVTVEINKQMKEHALDRNWHYSDEENFYDLYERASKAVTSFEELGKDNLLVVSHSATIRMMIAVMIFADMLTPEMFERMRSHIKISNTGITLCEYDGERWRLLTWNDYAHLGE